MWKRLGTVVGTGDVLEFGKCWGQSDAVTGDRNYGDIVGTGKAQDLKQNTQLLAQGGGHFGDRGEETCKGTERAQIILVGRERVQKGKMICDNPVPLNSRCSVTARHFT